MIARLLYTLLVVALLPWALLHLLLRGRQQPEYFAHWRERLGYSDHSGRSEHDDDRLPRVGDERPTLWIHAVSVGETRAAQPLVAALRARYPGYRLLLTHMTPTGRATGEQLYGDRVERCYLPYDTPWAMRRFLRQQRPSVGLVMETELWPNLIAACRAAGVPLLLVNARLSARSAARYARLPALTRPALRGLAAIGAQSAEDAERLRQVGGLPEMAVTLTGNMKFDIAPPPAQLALAAEFRAGFGARPVWLAASTRDGEEALILDAWTKVGAGGTAIPNTTSAASTPAPAAVPAPLLVIVPRHPQRFNEVAALVTARGLRLQRRSEHRPVAADTQVLLGDSMGEMFAWYAAVDLAFIGGSLLDYGSQNLIEACAVGTPVLIGPSTRNFAEAAREAAAVGAARGIADADELVRAVDELLAEPAERARMGAAGRAFAARHRGATARTLALVERVFAG